MTDLDTDRIVQQLYAEFAAAAKLDYVGFWEIVVAASNCTPGITESCVADIALAVSRRMIDGGVQVFRFADGKPTPIFWDASTTDAMVDRIHKEWDSLQGRPVGLGDVCWFVMPSC
jgi:hypothetical protein